MLGVGHVYNITYNPRLDIWEIYFHGNGYLQVPEGCETITKSLEAWKETLQEEQMVVGAELEQELQKEWESD